jgi:hypothetical protein
MKTPSTSLSTRIVATTLLTAAVSLSSWFPRASAAAAQLYGVPGTTSEWRLEFLSAQGMYRIPHTDWQGYHLKYMKFHLFVLKLRLTNVGKHRADPYDDLGLGLMVMPSAHDNTKGALGIFGPLDMSNKYNPPFYRQVLKIFGGAPPWQATSPGQTTTYCYLMGTPPGHSHYGLYDQLIQGGQLKHVSFLTSIGI